MEDDFPELADILARFKQEWLKVIDTPTSWHPHIVACHKELLAIDPGYSILQVKEKMGGLRYYFEPSKPEFLEDMRQVTFKYEENSLGYKWGNW